MSAECRLLAKVRVPLTLAAGILVLDQATKLAITRHLGLGDRIAVVDGLFDVVHARNPGAAFSLLASAPAWFRGPFFIAVTLLAIVAVVTVAARSAPEERLLRMSLGGILGGALGNLVDRLVHGEVIDFLDVYWRAHHWPAFNVADSAISVSVAAIFVHSLFASSRKTPPPGPSQP